GYQSATEKGNSKTSYGKSSGKIGDFTELEGSTVDEILDRIPDEAVLRELYPVQGGATEGFEFKWVQNGQTYRVRVHNVDPSAPVGSNAYNGWVVRAQRGRRYFDPTINDFREVKYFNPNGPDYDEVIINDTHIPILDPYQN
ncbi:polymorphic toxin type 30 domain-containing protein, partial [Roseburia inulinivorans]